MEEYKSLGESYNKLLKKEIKTQKELNNLKDEIKKINFRDISKIIINNYIE